MAEQKPRRKMSNKVKRTIRKTSAAVLMASAIAVAAIPAGNIEAQTPHETNTGVVVADDPRELYTYEIHDDRTDDYKDSQSTGAVYYGKINSNSLATYHRRVVDNLPLNEGEHFKRSYSVRRYSNDRNFYLNWQFEFDGEVLCKYNDQFLESVVELPFLVYTKFYTVSDATYRNFYENGTGKNDLRYTFLEWFDEGDRSNPKRGDGKVIMQFFPTRMPPFIKSCEEFVTKCDNAIKENEEKQKTLKQQISDLDAEIDFLRMELAALDSSSDEYREKEELLNRKIADRTNKQTQLDELQANVPLPAEQRDESEQPKLVISPSTLSAQEQYKYFCAKFVPRVDGVGDDASLSDITSYGGDISDYTVEMAYDMSTGDRKTVYIVKYSGEPDELVNGATTDSNGFLVIDFSQRGITAIGDYAFEGIGTVDVLTLHDRVKYIGDYAFANSFIKSVTIPNADIIGNAAFKNCGQLTKLSLGTSGALNTIGAEAFYGSALESLELPYAVSNIGPGAFAECTSLKTIDLSAITANNCIIDEAAFYDAESLSSILFPPATVGSIKRMGEATLAVNFRNVPLSVELPAKMSELPPHLFAGRSNLKSVIMPAGLGVSAVASYRVPSDVFMGCTNLEYVRFPEEAKFVNYDNDTTYEDADGNTLKVFPLFLDIDNPDFYVQGPAYSTGTVEAYERRDTWNCITNVNNFVPYIYELNGVMYYEVSDGKYILTADEMGELLSCKAVAENGLPIDLVIPKKVGNYTIKTVVDGCFSNEYFRNHLRSITVEDDTISEIAADVFKNLPRLKWVDLGDSIEKIGANAFAGCEALVDVTFRAEQVALGDNAFKTGGDELTFHGKIAADFGPFTWAMQKDNLVKGNGVRVCYKSLSPTLLTVMYDDGTDMVTLVDYPKYNDLDDLHKTDSIEYWYSLYSSMQYDNLRNDFREAWLAAVQDTTDVAAAKAAVYADDILYGPWVTPKFCEDVGKIITSGSLGTSADKPVAYFSHDDHQYSIIGKMDSEGGKIWDEFTADENAWIDACLNIVIPSGVQSIDTREYFKNKQSNGTNIATYFKVTDDLSKGGITRASLNMYNDTTGKDALDGKEITPGAFSGDYKDYTTDSDDAKSFEKGRRGNDRIQSITLTDVQYLPKRAFDSCERLEKVILGPALSDIGELPFYGCYNLKEVIGNDYYTTDNGLILTAMQPGDGTYTLVECLPGRGHVVGSATVPDDANATEKASVANISQIANGAFEGCNDIRIVNLFESTITTVPERCFAECPALDTVYLPYTTNSIKDEAFAEDDTVTVSIPAKEVFIASNAFVHGEKAKREPEHGKVKFITYPDSAAAEYARYYDISLIDMASLHTVWFNDYNGVPLIDKPFYVQDGDVISGEERPAEPTRNGYEFDKWISNTGIPVDGRIYEDTIFTATYIAVEGSHDGKFFVMFYDGVDGSQIGERQEVDPGTEVTPPEAPKHDKYKFEKWSTDEYKKVEKDLIVTALYSPTGSSSGGGNSGGGGSGGGNSGGGGSGDNSDDKDKDKEKDGKKYTVVVKNGTGSGSYEVDATVAIVANTPETGKAFSKWTTEDKEVSFVNAAMSATTFKMPAKDVTVTAEFVDSTATTTAVASPTAASTYFPQGYGSGTDKNKNDDKNNAQVIVSKPGISNIDLATAKVNGSSDSFVIKVTETNEAEEKVRSALTNRYGSIEDRIRYWACDISLYDSTGNTKIEDTTGLSVDITLPVPDDLRSYGGNNMVGAVADGVLESLTPKFNEINGVPCVTFTATHFSPYTIYVDSQNLSASQMLDATPKTGDPIHPKWFLSVGLAAVSILLFMKKDKKNQNVLKTA